ncbi:hypothetical protein J7I93_09275 [Bacillus sp. ISL-47]|uniref:RHS repeat-associated core domain-containing protein n=1 Tax=Bacillus sp. ISL-47 TaxID=2819130 RepID=UPI001BECA23D|nr:RHS repeat-associated core domain-containing protein [Bacillus sp. ISL-47]MBT2688372.1 hypothetical protein [Bacillus sp. ISL-47]MBT2710517.1 hypothetical protein [Pseudomonas sp. ISL-84]
MLARYYNPDDAVFLSLDPLRGNLEEPITQNGYIYANNNPVMMVDPDGNQARARREQTAGGLVGILLLAVELESVPSM